MIGQKISKTQPFKKKFLYFSSSQSSMIDNYVLQNSEKYNLPWVAFQWGIRVKINLTYFLPGESGGGIHLPKIRMAYDN